MNIRRAIEILDPEHREPYCEREGGLEEIIEACRMGMEALKAQLAAGDETMTAAQRERAIYEAALQTYGTNPRTIKPQGEWIDMYGGKYDNPRYACSKCGGKALCKIEADVLGHEKAVQALTAYCPNCGVKMDLEA